MKSVAARLSATALAATAALILAGCVGASSEVLPSESASSSSEPTEAAVDHDVFAERQAFMEAQQLPMDGSPLVAITDAQKQFIAEQSAYVESQGVTWTPEAETISLALAADACETSILNRHEIDGVRFQTHVATSPLFANLVPADGTPDERVSVERNVASIMVFGTGFLCPADAAQWQAAFDETYSG